jgi:hypothetical protein
MYPGTLEKMTSTEIWKWKLCLAKSRDLHKSTKKDSTIMRTLSLLDNMGIVRRLQREKTFWNSLNNSVKTETVLE